MQTVSEGDRERRERERGGGGDGEREVGGGGAEVLSPFLTGRMFVRRTYVGHFDEL